LFISSVYLDITKRVRSPELISLLEWCRSRGTPLIIGMYCNSHSYLYSDMENNRGIELESVVSKYGLEIHNCGLVPTFAGAGPNGTVNNSIIDVTLSTVVLRRPFFICPLKDRPNLKCPLLSFKGRNLSFFLPFTPILQSKLQCVCFLIHFCLRPDSEAVAEGLGRPI
jgi:hypothetical protein